MLHVTHLRWLSPEAAVIYRLGWSWVVEDDLIVCLVGTGCPRSHTFPASCPENKLIFFYMVVVFQKQQERRQAPMCKLRHGSFMLMFHWPKQVTRPGPSSTWEGLHEVEDTGRHVSLG